MTEWEFWSPADTRASPHINKLVPYDLSYVGTGNFKAVIDRVVKEEIIDESAHLPCFNGRVVSWLVAAESSASDTQSQCDSQQGDPTPPPNLPGERVGGIGDSRPPSFHANASSVHSQDNEPCDTCTETDSVISSRRDRQNQQVRSSSRQSITHPRDTRPNNDNLHITRVTNGHNKHERHRGGGHGYETSSSVITSDIETTSFFDSEDDASSRFSSMTDATSRSSKYGRHRRRKRKHRMPPISRVSTALTSLSGISYAMCVFLATTALFCNHFPMTTCIVLSPCAVDGGVMSVSTSIMYILGCNCSNSRCTEEAKARGNEFVLDGSQLSLFDRKIADGQDWSDFNGWL
ncbi:segment polarity protein dishevelled homolog DVL-3-like [Lingula anatina]|uniref:Segment polarity protein dishevelled homolog DVL-3-like n=1 Tax=Lingula anatina TaxID=7574 RepID=A0A1S3I962_LINAN|nr:segment polarity protein dishevelled homolog DVL-3-like [Lingula anatina]|eukprot:XP_013394728.1 segment polarity protein dishevelled homolog DVL-3-like [Lingula anatina]